MRRTDRRGRFQLSAGVQIVALTMLLLLVAAVVMQVFSASVGLSRRARALNDGVQLCRNTAEAFIGVQGDLEQTVLLLGGAGTETVLYFDRDLHCTQPASASYTLTLTAEREETEAGALVTGHFTAAERSGTEIYTMEMEVYQP